MDGSDSPRNHLSETMNPDRTPRLDKSLATNVVAAAVVGASFALPEGPARRIALQTGLFALSGAVTNWLAVHMLFERVPLLYGSGIIPNRFEEFKIEIRRLILDNFFTEENFAKLTHDAADELDWTSLTNDLSYDEVFDGLVAVIRDSSFGPMLNMVGGTSVLEKFREPATREFKKRVDAIVSRSNFRDVVAERIGHAGIREKVTRLVDARLDELTPSMVKEIVQEMIRRHLGWLVVWGGVFGGLIGLVCALLLG